MALTRLDAVNQILQGSAETIFLVEPSGNSDWNNALNILNTQTREVLAKGFEFNTDSEYPFNPDANKKIAVPANVLAIDADDVRQRYVVRSGYLYDKDLRVDTFDGPVKCSVTWDFTFDQCPFHVQTLIVKRAKVAYQRSYVGSQSFDNANTQELAEAAIDAQTSEADVEDFNVFNNPDMHYIRRHTYNRNNF